MFECVFILALFSAPTEEWPVLWPTVPPVIQSAEKEYAAPIPDSLAGYDVHELSDADGNPVRIVLEKPVADEVLVRRDGPTHPWPDQPCPMCLGNHAIQIHGQSANYLRSITDEQWQVLHDNLHNDPATAKVRKQGSGYIGYGETGGYSGRAGLLERLFRRWGR